MKYLLLLYFFVNISPVSACDCLYPDLNDAFESANSIFLGKVISKTSEPNASSTAIGHLRVRFELKKIYKGLTNDPMLKSIEVVTASDGNLCGYHFEIDKEYVVYAPMYSDGQLRAISCSLTKLKDRASEELIFLENYLYKKEKKP